MPVDDGLYSPTPDPESYTGDLIALFDPNRLAELNSDEKTRVLSELGNITAETPVRTLLFPGSHPDHPGEQILSIYIIGYDHNQLFSIITAVLAASGYQISNGNLLTSEAVGSRAWIIDHFQGSLPRRIDPDTWFTSVTAELETFFSMLESPEHSSNLADRIQQLSIETVAASLRGGAPPREQLLRPVQIRYSDPPGLTRVEIRSVDTAFFLFSLSSVLNLHQLRIESVRISTKNSQVIDTIDFTDRNGKAVTSERTRSRITLSILLSKQFTYFLDQAPDPSKALQRFDELIQDFSQAKGGEELRELFASAEFHQELAKLLGTSDFIWEDFIRIQRDSLVPMLKTANRHKLLSNSPEQMEKALARHLRISEKMSGEGASLAEENTALQIQLLNEFKNRQSFLIDLDHILSPDLDFFFLSRRLSALADTVIRHAAGIAWQELTARHGIPRSAGGLETLWAVCGLGKLGGQAMGYASDLELLWVYSDSGNTDGPKPLANRDFFEKFFKRASGIITAKKQGIFQVDLRLRPFGDDGPLAVKLERFQEYYRAGGKAHSAERLALVRLRPIGGNSELGKELQGLRDHIVYESDSLNIPEIRELRQVQLKEKLEEQRINTKYSAGGLVDLEYNVQILQVTYGRKNNRLRGPGIHMALESLASLGTIENQESEQMVEAYRFLRNLINALRMLRGNAADLFMPPRDNREYRILARRMGYRVAGGISEADLLTIEWETRSAQVRQFVEKHLGREAIPGKRNLSVLDLLLGSAFSQEEMTSFFEHSSFREAGTALVNLRSLSSKNPVDGPFYKLIILAWKRISTSVDPDMLLNNWEQFVNRLSRPLEHFRQLLNKPRRMDILFAIFSGSQFLSDTLIQNPRFFLWATDPAIVARPRTQIEMEDRLNTEAQNSQTREEWQNRLRLTRKQELLRIGIRDISLGVRIEEVMGELSFLARACCEVALNQAWERALPEEYPHFAQRMTVLAFGKLGGWELNYSSDIDLMAIYSADERDLASDGRASGSKQADENSLFTGVFREMVKDLNDFTREGQAYRVDLRLRPYGASGPLVSGTRSTLNYYRRQAEPWEFQAAIKLKPVAGNLVKGEEFLDALKPGFSATWQTHDPRESITHMRTKSMQHHLSGGGADLEEDENLILPGFDVKNERGGIRDIEFLIQGMQMLHSGSHPSILTGNSLRGLQLLERNGLIDPEVSDMLTRHYRLLRRTEHFLQLARNRQEHRLPTDTEERRKLSRLLDPEKSSDEFYRYFGSVLREVHAIYRDFIESR